MAVVVVDDEDIVRTTVGLALCRHGLDVRVCESAGEAIAAIAADEGSVELVVSDVAMPGAMDGLALAEHLAQHLPSVPVVIMSGDPALLEHARKIPSVIHLLQKPFKADVLLAAVDAAMAGRRSSASAQLPAPTPKPSIPAFRPVDIMPILRLAAQEAARTKHQHVGSEQIALVALGGPDGLEAMAMESGLDPSALRPALDVCCHSPEWDREPTITPRSARMLAFASQLAILDGSGEIRPIHLIHTLLGEPGAVAWSGLFAAGLTPAHVASAIERRRSTMA